MADTTGIADPRDTDHRYRNIMRRYYLLPLQLLILLILLGMGGSAYALTVTYDGNTSTGGTVPTDASIYNNGDSVTVLGNTGSLVKTGYTFGGWNTVADGSGTSYVAGIDTFLIAGNTILYAKWTAAVTYNGNGSDGGSVPTDATGYLSGATVTAAGNTGTLTKTGFTFAGWNTAANGMGTSYAAGVDTFFIAGNTTLYAKWTAAVTYNGNGSDGGSVPTDATGYLSGATVTAAGNTGTLTKTGFTFAGWNTAANSMGTSYAAGVDTFFIAGNTTLYAKWTAAVTYNGNGSNGGSVPTDATGYLSGATVTAAGNTGTLTKTGFTFAGWNTAANGMGTSYAAGSDTFIITTNTTLYAKWTYGVTYNGNGNDGGAIPTDSTGYLSGAMVTAANNTGTLTKTGYAFAGWNTLANGLGTNYTAGSGTFNISANTTLYAKWTLAVNGACGTSNGIGVSSTPATNLCTAGAVSAVAGTGPWTWSCNGSGGGTNASCSALVSQVISFATPLPVVVVSGTGTVSATGGASTNPVTFTSTTTSVCTVSGSTITGVATGKCTIAANQAGNANYAAAPQKTQDITIGKGSQTITFGAQTGKVFDTAPFTLDPLATASSGLAVSYTAAPASVCKINSTTITLVAAGTCTITASQSGNSNYSAASAVAQAIIISQASQTITFGTQAAKNFGAAPFTLNPLAAASSGLSVTYSSITPTVCSINGSTVTIIAIGTCTIAANQVGNATYGTALQVTQSIVISKGSQTITFGAQTGKAFGAAPFKLSPLATADSKLEVAYTSQTPSVCTISGSTVTIVSAGACTIAADQAGDSNYNAATRVTRDITISKGTQKITFGTQTSKAFSTTPFTLSPLATTDSGLAVTYTSTTPLICSTSGSAVTMVMPGTCTIAANQAGDGNYSAAPQITQSIIFSKGTQTITFGAQSPQIIGVAPFALNPVATANSGLEVSYSASPTTTCTISGTTVTALAIGTCTISVSQAGDSYYSAATAVTQGIVIAKTTAPGVPTLTGVTAGYGSATLSFDAPASNGGSKITAYNAACAATGETTRTGTGAASSITVQGLTIGVTYSCSVAATNSVGTSAASLGLPVTPLASYIVPTTTSNPLTSMWWNEQEPGWGMSITQHGAMVFMGWYAYDASGVPTWYVISSCPMLGNACTGEIYAVSGGDSFVTPWDGSAKIVTKVGIGILTFTNANTGTFNFSINGQPGFKFITRQTFAIGFTTPNPDYSDLWWNPSESGWGVVLTQQYGIIFAVLFGYDETGNPTWYVASDCRVDGNYCSGSLYQVKGGTVPTTTWDGTNLVVTTVGFIEFVFGDASNGTMNYFINGVAGTKVITRQSF